MPITHRTTSTAMAVMAPVAGRRLSWTRVMSSTGNSTTAADTRKLSTHRLKNSSALRAVAKAVSKRRSHRVAFQRITGRLFVSIPLPFPGEDLGGAQGGAADFSIIPYFVLSVLLSQRMAETK